MQEGTLKDRTAKKGEPVIDRIVYPYPRLLHQQELDRVPHLIVRSA